VVFIWIARFEWGFQFLGTKSGKDSARQSGFWKSLHCTTSFKWPIIGFKLKNTNCCVKYVLSRAIVRVDCCASHISLPA
jgi:hypothetical protein